jgi:hypothetical protein
LTLLPPTARPAILRQWNRLTGREPLPWQEQLEADTHRNALVVVGRRGGKTDEAGNWLVAGTAFDGLPGAALAPDYKKADFVFGAAWLAARQAHLLDVKASSLHEGLLILRRSVMRGKRGGRIERRTADAKTGNVGFALRRMVWDEVCRTYHGQRIWSQDFRPTLADYHGEALWITTPAGWDHVHDLYQRIRAKREPDWGLVEAPSWLNHHVYPGGRNDPEILAIEKEYEEAGVEELFAQEYGAEFTVVSGRVFKRWNPKTMVVPHAECVRNVNQFWIGYDWGWSREHPSVFVLLGRTSGGDWRILDEWYGIGCTWPEITKGLEGLCRRNDLTKKQIERLYYDPSRPEQGAMFRRDDWPASAAVNDRVQKILAVGSAIGRPGGLLASKERAPRVAHELATLRHPDNSEVGEMRVVKIADDGYDCTAYVLASAASVEHVGKLPMALAH